MAVRYNTGYGRTAHVQHEGNEQECLFRWAEYFSGKYPQLELMYHIPNGGKRNSAEAARLKREGVKAGVPDIFLPVPCGNYHGMYIELKYGKNKTTENQDKWLDALAKQGYYTVVCYGWESAAKEIERYLKIEKE